MNEFVCIFPEAENTQEGTFILVQDICLDASQTYDLPEWWFFLICKSGRKIDSAK